MPSSGSIRRNILGRSIIPKDVQRFINDPTNEGLHRAISHIYYRPTSKSINQQKETFLILFKKVLEKIPLIPNITIIIDLFFQNGMIQDERILNNIVSIVLESHQPNNVKIYIIVLILDRLLRSTTISSDTIDRLFNLHCGILLTADNSVLWKINISNLLISKLIDKGLDITLKDSDGKTALHYAMAPGVNDSILQLLLDAGADVNARDNDNKTVLHYAMALGVNDSILQLLLDAGADVNAQDNKGDAALHYIYAKAPCAQPAKIAALLRAAANVNIMNSGNETPLFNMIILLKEHSELRVPCSASLKESIQLLMNAGADPRAINPFFCALAYALELNDNSILRILLPGTTSTDLGSQLISSKYRDLLAMIRVNHIYNFPIEYVGKNASTGTSTMYRVYGLFLDKYNNQILIGEISIKGELTDATQLKDITIRFKNATNGTWRTFDAGTGTVIAGGRRTRIHRKYKKYTRKIRAVCKKAMG